MQQTLLFKTVDLLAYINKYLLLHNLINNNAFINNFILLLRYLVYNILV